MAKSRTHSSLAAYLKATKQTQEQFAAVVSRRVGKRIRQSQISLWVSGAQMPRPSMALILSELTGVSLENMARGLTRKVAA